jgi:hypothetical protein
MGTVGALALHPQASASSDSGAAAARLADLNCGLRYPHLRSDGHHLTHWARGGSTDLENLVSVCRAHHWKLHEGGWRLIRNGDGMVVVPPVPFDLLPPRGLAPEDPLASVAAQQWEWLPHGSPPAAESECRAPVAAGPARARAPDAVPTD